MTPDTDDQRTDTHTPTADDADADRDALVHHWTIVLAEYWRQADWEQFTGQQKRRSESFEERLLSAQNAGNIHGTLKKLARGLGMAAPDLPTENLDPLVEHDDEAMRVLQREDIYLVNKTRETVQNYYDDHGDGDDSDGEPQPTTSTLSDYVTEA